MADAHSARVLWRLESPLFVSIARRFLSFPVEAPIGSTSISILGAKTGSTPDASRKFRLASDEMIDRKVQSMIAIDDR